MIRERNQTFKLALISIDLITSVLAVATALIFHFVIINPEKAGQVVPDRYGLFAPGEFFGEEFALVGTYSFLGFLYVIIQVTVFIATDLYQPRRGINFLREFMAIVRSVAINMLFVLALLFFYRGASFSRWVIVYLAFFSIFYHSLAHYFFREILSILRARGYNIKKVLILGTGPMACRFVDSLLEHKIYGYKVVGLIGPGSGLRDEYKKLLRGRISDLKKIYARFKPDTIVYALPANPAKISMILEFCDSEGIDCRIIPEWRELITHRARIEAMDGIPILTIRDVPLRNGYNRFLKRVFDISFSLFVIVLSFPILIGIAILIKLTSRGPVFFTQERVGLDRRTYTILKFRTMYFQDESTSDTRWGTIRDERITTTGRILRLTSLDELPQFFNVLKGDMSVVGPRAERPYFVKKFKSKYLHYMRRHDVKSGITGWAQIQGFRGDTSIQKRVEADIYYIENWSLWLDTIIILRTIPAIIKNPGS